MSLLNSKPLMVDPELAEMIGLNEALVLQQIHYWLKQNEKKKINKINGRWWTYNTVAEWQENFPFWSTATVKRTLQNLRKLEIVITGVYNERPGDRTLWYSIDYEALHNLENEFTKDKIAFQEKLKKILKPLGQNDQKVKLTRPKGQIDPTNPGAKGQIDPSVTRDFSSETYAETSCIVTLAQNCELYQHWWGKFCEGLPDMPEKRGNAFRLMCDLVEKYRISVDQLVHALREAVQRDHPGHIAYLGGIIENMAAKRYIDTERPIHYQVEDLLKQRLADMHGEYYTHYECDHEVQLVLYIGEQDDSYIERYFLSVAEDIERQCGVRYVFRNKSLLKKTG